MRQLTSLDAQFLALETPRQSGHVAGLAILDPSTRPGGALACADIKVLLTERLPLRLRWGLVLPAALVTYGGACVLLIVRTWASDLRFLPWTDLVAAASHVSRSMA